MASDSFEGWESAEEVLAFAVAAGQNVSRTQLVRWHKRGPIPRPRTRYQPGRRGLETLYPPGTSALVAEVSALHARTKLLDSLAWRVWWTGHDQDMAAVRSYAEKACREFDETLERIRGLVRGNSKDGTGIRAVRNHLSNSSDLPPPVGSIRRHLDWGGGRDFERFVSLLVGTIVGETKSLDSGDCRLIERAFHFDEARRTPLSGSQDWWEQEDGSGFVWMAKFLSRSLTDRLKEIPDDRFLEARDEAQAFFKAIVTFGEVMNWAFKRQWGLGFGFAGRAVQRLVDDPKRQVAIVVLFHAFRNDPELSENLHILRDSMRDWSTESYQDWKRLRFLAEEVPELDSVVSPLRMREAFRTQQGWERLNKAIAAFRAQHAEEIDCVISAHPELFRRGEAFAGSPNDAWPQESRGT